MLHTYKKRFITFHVRHVSNNKPHFWLHSSTRIKFLQNNVINQENFTSNKHPPFNITRYYQIPKYFTPYNNLYNLRITYDSNPSNLLPSSLKKSTKLIRIKKKHPTISIAINKPFDPPHPENRNDQANPLSLGHKLAVIYTGGGKNGRFPSKRLSSGGTNEADSRGREESSAGAENGSASRLQGGGRATSFVDFIYDSM